MQSSITTRALLNSSPLCSLFGSGGVEFLVPATGRFQPDKQSGRFEMNYRHRHEWRRQRRSSVGDLLWRRNSVCVRNNSRGRKPELLCVCVCVCWLFIDTGLMYRIQPTINKFSNLLGINVTQVLRCFLTHFEGLQTSAFTERWSSTSCFVRTNHILTWETNICSAVEDISVVLSTVKVNSCVRKFRSWNVLFFFFYPRFRLVGIFFLRGWFFCNLTLAPWGGFWRFEGKILLLHNPSPALEISLWNPNVHYLIDISLLNECPLVCETRSFFTVFLDIMHYSGWLV